MDYLHLLDQLVAEHERCLRQRQEADSELARLKDLIRSTVRLLPPEQQTRAEQMLDRLDEQPVGLTAMIRLALADGGWQTPAEIRDFLSTCGVFTSYRSNPLASIHTTLRRMVPDTLETRRERGAGSTYRLRRGEPLARARAGAARLRAIRGAGRTLISGGRSWVAVPMPNRRDLSSAVPSSTTSRDTDEP
jgi:hypothetical protein